MQSTLQWIYFSAEGLHTGSCYLIHSHLQEFACSEPTQSDQEEGKQSQKFLRIRDLELWERNFSFHVLLRLKTYLWRAFFQQESCSLSSFLAEKQQFGRGPLAGRAWSLQSTKKDSEAKTLCSLPHHNELPSERCQIHKTRNSGRQRANRKVPGIPLLFQIHLDGDVYHQRLVLPSKSCRIMAETRQVSCLRTCETE